MKINYQISIIVLILSYSFNVNAFEATTSTGLDKIIQLINEDSALKNKVAQQDIEVAAATADRMNWIILEAIWATGVANDNIITTPDAREINSYIINNHQQTWITLHGDDEKKLETGFHLIQNDGARSRLFRKNAIDKVADSIYHLGLVSNKKNNLVNEDGKNNARYSSVAKWLNHLLLDDLIKHEYLHNPSISETYGSTNTRLDELVDKAYADSSVQSRLSFSQINEVARAVDGMNQIILNAFTAMGYYNEKKITELQVVYLNEYIYTNYATEWASLVGNSSTDNLSGFAIYRAIKNKNDGLNQFYQLGQTFDVDVNLKKIANTLTKKLLRE